ncbi:endospore germination permease [Bacillus sp. CGMCC 1.16607]|uniref:GerAB/ArcD/ProY family transporter n=1 Tax=Bacillus sp. CGMCC 1.16607 TaxID=3351842 RepID=UPI0036348B4E
MEKGKISALQMSMMMFPTIMATAILTVPGFTAKYAKQDLWISPLWASLVGFMTVYISVRLNNLYPNYSFFQKCEKILGKLLGKLLGSIYVLLFILVSGQITRSYAEFITGVFFPRTPISVIIISMIILSAFTVIGGIEVVGRVSQIFFPIFFISVLFIFMMLIPQLKPENIFPIMEFGVLPSIKGAIVSQAWFGEFFLISFLLPLLSDVKKGMKWGMITVFLVLLTFITSNLLVLFILGHQTQVKIYPFLVAARFANIGNFIENLDPLIIAFWILGAFVKITVFLYVTVFGTAQWLNLSDYRPIVWPLGILIIEFSFWSFPNLMAASRFDTTIWPFWGILMQTLIPFVLLILISLKNKFKKP